MTDKIMPHSNQLVLVESKAARDAQCQTMSQEQAQDALSKAKALVFAMWQGVGLATTEQVAEYYEVSLKTIENLPLRNKAELQEDGLKCITGKALKELTFKMKGCSSNAKSILGWTPRSVLRAGMLLRDSDVAKQVRTLLLDLTELSPKQSEALRLAEMEITTLKLQLAIATEQRYANQFMLESKKMDDSMLTMHGAQVVLALRGKSDQVVEIEKPTLEVIDEKTGVKFKGMSLNQFKDYANQKYGVRFKSGAEIGRFLESAGYGHLIAQTPRRILTDYIPDEFVDNAVKVLSTSHRQLLLGETDII